MTVISSREKESYASGQERFLEEARILAKLQNLSGVVSVQNYFRENNTAYFVMDYIDGMSLKDYLLERGGKLPYAEALHILLPVMEALVQVHALNLLHRDISPDNISITNRGETKLLDFGAARFALGDDKSVSVILKHGYAPEEQYRSHGNQGPWTDVYAMGATLYNCVTGALIPDSIDRLHEDRLVLPSHLGIQLPPGAEDALKMALAVKAEDRFSNMQSMIRALTGGAVGQTVAGGATTPVYSATQEAAPPSAQGKLAALLSRCKTDKRLLLGICGGVAVIALAIILPLTLGKKEKAVPTDGGGQSVSPPAVQSDPLKSEAPDLPTLSTPQPANELRLEPYENSRLAISMDVVRGYERSEDMEKNMVLFSGENAALAISFAPCAGVGLYSLEDYEKNADVVLNYMMDDRKVNITTKGYTTVNGAKAYNVEFETETVQGMLMMLETKGGFGGYFLCPVVQKDLPAYDERLNELFTMMNSFKTTGAPQNDWRLVSSEELGFKFVYDARICEGGYKTQRAEKDKVPCVFLYLNENNPNNVIEVEKTDLYGATPEKAMDYLSKAIEENFVKKNDAPYELKEEYSSGEFGNYEILFRSYALSIPNRDYLGLLATTSIEGEPFAVGVFHDPEFMDSCMAAAVLIYYTLRPL